MVAGDIALLFTGFGAGWITSNAGGYLAYAVIGSEAAAPVLITVTSLAPMAATGWGIHALPAINPVDQYSDIQALSDKMIYDIDFSVSALLITEQLSPISIQASTACRCRPYWRRPIQESRGTECAVTA